jgi:hypothetical protein
MRWKDAGRGVGIPVAEVLRKSRWCRSAQRELRAPTTSKGSSLADAKNRFQGFQTVREQAAQLER